MRGTVVFVLLVICTLFTSCDRRQAAINDLKDFSEELKENSSEYTEKDWENASAKYEQLVEKIDKYEYTDEELKEIGRLKARCLKEIGKSAIQQLQEGIHSFSKQLEGAFEEFTDDGSSEANDEDVEE